MNFVLQVEHLKPGTPYSFRLRIVPITVPPLAVPLSPSPSDIAVFSTLPAAPSQPSSPVLVNRARTSLKVLVYCRALGFLAILYCLYEYLQMLLVHLPVSNVAWLLVIFRYVGPFTGLMRHSSVLI